MPKHILGSATCRIAFAWAFFLPLSYILYHAISLAFGSDTAAGSQIGEIGAFFLGGAACGLATSLVLRRRYPNITRGQILIITAGWAAAMLVVALLQQFFEQMLWQVLD